MHALAGNAAITFDGLFSVKVLQNQFLGAQAVRAFPDDSALYARVPVELESQLMDFQREGVRFALKAGGRALIGDEMGLGCAQPAPCKFSLLCNIRQSIANVDWERCSSKH